MNKTDNNSQKNIRWFPHWNSASEHLKLAKTSKYWFGHVVLAMCMVIPVLGRVIALVERLSCKKVFVPSKGSNTPSLKERLLQPISTKEEEKVTTDPLDLSAPEIALCASGLFTLAHSTIGLPWGMQFLGTPKSSGLLFRSSVYTQPTTILGSFLSMTLATIMTASGTVSDSDKKNQSHPVVSFAKNFINQIYAPAPFRTLAQADLTYKQTTQAVKGIQTCIQHVGKKDSLTIARNLFVHTVNIATSGYNLFTSAKISYQELLYFKTWALNYMYSEEEALNVMGTACPAFFTPTTPPFYKTPPLPVNPTLFERVKFIWSTTSNSISNTLSRLSHPIALCFPLDNTK